MAQVNPEIVLFMLGFDCCLEGTGKSPHEGFRPSFVESLLRPKILWTGGFLMKRLLAALLALMMLLSAAAENWRFAAGATFSQSPAVSAISSPSITALPLPARMA